jgi:hypothetical protein
LSHDDLSLCEPVALRCSGAGVLEHAFFLSICAAICGVIACPKGSSDRRLPGTCARLYASSVILLEIGLIVAIVAYFIAMDLYVRGCDKL